jgi:hypothetical protein
MCTFFGRLLGKRGRGTENEEEEQCKEGRKKRSREEIN